MVFDYDIFKIYFIKLYLLRKSKTNLIENIRSMTGRIENSQKD